MSRVTRCLRRCGWKWQSTSWTIVGGALASLGDCALAQVVPDGTLLNNSIVTPSGNTSQISGGTQAGSNLFHSFEQFSVPTGGAAYFDNALNIQNIISRVTGGSVSNIDGLLRANGTANLFLLNPNGIIFGPNAQLNIGGSFVGSTASSLNFADGTSFRATAPQTTPLLTVSVPLGLQFGGEPGRILVQGSGQGIRTTSELIDTTVGLRVQPNQTLALVGGNVALSGGTLKTAGGRIELGSVAGSGLVTLTPVDSGLALGYSGVPTLGDIQLSSGATVDASGEGSGDIQVRGRQLTLTDGSTIEASTLGAEPGGTVNVTTEESVEIIGTTADGQLLSSLLTLVYPGATGNGGNLTLETGELIVRDGAQIAASTFGSGSAGILAVSARESVELIGTSASDSRIVSGLFTTANQGATGVGGNLTLKMGRLILRDGAQIAASTFDKGSAGTLEVRASDSVELIGTSADGQLASGLYTSVNRGATGAGGKLTLETGRLIVRDGAQVAASTLGKGSAGTLEVRASDSVELIGSSAIGQQYTSGLFNQVNPGATGNGGNLTVETERLIVRDRAQIAASTFGSGSAGTLVVSARELVELIGTTASDSGIGSGLFTSVNRGATGSGGNLTVETRRLIVRDGAQVFTGTSGAGAAGSLMVRALESVELSGTTADGQFSSALYASTQRGATGSGGNLTVETQRLIVRDGAQIATGTFGSGAAGTLMVNASESVELRGTSAFDSRASGLFTSVVLGATGTGGNLTVETGRLIVQDGAAVSAATFGSGAGGTLSISARDSVGLIGTTADGQFPSRLTARTTGTGDAGDVTIKTEQLTVLDGAQVTVSSQGSGNAGNLEVAARSIRLDNQALLSANTTAGQGNIYLRSRDLVLRRDSNINTNATGTATGGNISIDTDFIAAWENSDIRADSTNSFGGRVTINAQGIFGTEFRLVPTSESDITATSDLGLEFSGTVEINTPDVDLNRGLVNLPTVPIDTEVVQACQPGGQQGMSEFIITGRGGLPPNPGDSLSTDAVQVDLVTLNPEVDKSSTTAVSTNPTGPKPPFIIEAQGWVIDANGEIILTASAPTVTRYSSWQRISECHPPQNSF